MKTNKEETNIKGGAIISNTVKDRSNDPYFIKKAEEAKEFLRVAGAPGRKKLSFK